MIQGYKLKPFKRDLRDHTHYALFGNVSSALLTLNRQAIVMNDFDSSECVGYQNACAGSYKNKILMSGDYQEAKTFEVMGVTDTLTGADPKAGLLSGCIFGHLPQALAPFSLPIQSEQFVTNAENWDKTNDITAQQYLEPAFVIVAPQGGFDMFDSIKSALIQGQTSNEVVMVWTNWYQEWNETLKGIIPSIYGFPVAQHAYVYYDFCTINGIDYLKALPAQGTSFGDGGVVYFPREVVNKETAVTGMGCAIYKNVDEVSSWTFFMSTLSNLLTKLTLYFSKKKA